MSLLTTTLLVLQTLSGCGGTSGDAATADTQDGGPTMEASRWKRSTSPDGSTTTTTTAPTTTTASAVASTDIRVQADPGLGFAQQAWGNVQCHGQILGSASVPEPGLQGTLQPDGTTLRFGRAPDPEDATRTVYRYALNPDDPLTATSMRCEIAFSPGGTTGLPRNEVFWHAFAVRLPDWRNTTDEQQLMQWHAGDGTGLLPVYQLLVRGAQMRLVLRHDGSTAPSRSTTTALTLWSTTSWTPLRWMTVVTQARVSTDPAQAPFVRTWIDGAPVVSYSGPVGYNLPTSQPYVKHGIYHWLEYNAWDLRLTQRVVHMRRAALVQDPNRIYSEATLAGFVNAR